MRKLLNAIRDTLRSRGQRLAVEEIHASSSADAASPALARIAHEVAAQALRNQESSLNDLRARTSTLLAAGALAAGFLGGPAFSHAGFGAINSAGLASFATSFLLALGVLRPRRDITFSMSGIRLYEDAFGHPEPEIYRRLVYWAENRRAANDVPIKRLGTLFLLSVVLLLISVVLWVVAIASARSAGSSFTITWN